MKTKHKILTVIGARPQFIKAAVVSRELIGHPEISEIILHTGQHYDPNMSEVFFREMEIPHPSHNLGVQSSLQGEMTGKMLEGIEKIVLIEKPDAVLVYGDTNSTLAGALAASKLHIKLIHVEAGLRSFNMSMPEEVNRIVTDRISNLLFCPTQTAMNNLVREGFEHFDCSIINSGDVMFDAALFYSSRLQKANKTTEEKGFVLCTFHRAENTNDPVCLRNIVNAINLINKEVPVVFPIHPRTRKTLDALGLKLDCKVIEPVGYLSMLELLQNCSLVMTDSGGLQKEAFFFSKFCITMRNETEWTELVEHDLNILAGHNTDSILDAFRKFNKKNGDFSLKLFGDGKAAKVIVSEIEKHF